MTEMGGIYGTSTVCLNGTEWSNMTNGADTCLPLSPDLTNLMATSSDYKLRTHVWEVVFLISTIFVLHFLYLSNKFHHPTDLNHVLIAGMAKTSWPENKAKI